MSSASSWFDDTVPVGASSSRATTAQPPTSAQRVVSFVEELFFENDDLASVTSEKSPPSEGLRAVLRLLFQFCQSAASAAQPPQQEVCDFEGLFGASVSKPVSSYIQTRIFHRVSELIEDHRCKFQMNLEADKLPASGLPSHRRGPGACKEPNLRSAAPFNSSLFCLIGILSARRSISFSFDEAAKVESLVEGQLDSLSLPFWLFSTFLHWLKELGFVPLDPALFGQLVQLLSLPLVGSSGSQLGEGPCSSRSFSSVCLRLLRCSHGSWLLCSVSFIGQEFGCFGIWTTS